MKDTNKVMPKKIEMNRWLYSIGLATDGKWNVYKVAYNSLENKVNDELLIVESSEDKYESIERLKIVLAQELF